MTALNRAHYKTPKIKPDTTEDLFTVSTYARGVLFYVEHDQTKKSIENQLEFLSVTTDHNYTWLRIRKQDKIT